MGRRGWTSSISTGRWRGWERTLPETDQHHATHAPRCVKDAFEEALFARGRDLFSELDLVFFDTTSLYFTGEGGTTIGRFGHSKDRRPDCRQMVLGLVLDQDGHPVCSEMWLGNVAYVTALEGPLPGVFAIASASVPCALWRTGA